MDSNGLHKVRGTVERAVFMVCDRRAVQWAAASGACFVFFSSSTHARFLARKSTQVVVSGLDVDEALKANDNVCAAATLYRRVRKKREEIRRIASENTHDFLKSDAKDLMVLAMAADDDVSDLTPSPDKVSRKRKAPDYAHAKQSALEEGVRDGLEVYITEVAKKKALAEQAEAEAKFRRSDRIKSSVGKSDETIGTEQLSTDSANSSLEASGDSGIRAPYRTMKQTNFGQSVANSVKSDIDSRYKSALKEGTGLKKRGDMSYASIASMMNEKYELVEGERRLTKSTLHNYVKKKKIAVSPDRRGPAPRLPLAFWDLLDAHIDVTQLEGNQECKPRHLKALIGASLTNTEFSDLSVEKIYKRFRIKYPDTVSPTRAMEMEERRSLWTTYPNLNKWFDASKACLIHYGYAEDKPQLVVDIFGGRELPCEIDSESEWRHHVFICSFC